MGPYQIKQVYSNGTVLLESIDGKDIKLLANRYRLREYKKICYKDRFL